MVPNWPDLICSNVHPLLGPVALPLCARCSGIWLALGAGLCLPRRAWRGETNRWRFVAALGLAAAAPLHVLLFPDALDLGRFLSGALTGAGIAALAGRSPAAGASLACLLTIGAASRITLLYDVLSWLTLPAVLWSIGALLHPLLALLRSPSPSPATAREHAPVRKDEA